MLYCTVAAHQVRGKRSFRTPGGGGRREIASSYRQRLAAATARGLREQSSVFGTLLESCWAPMSSLLDLIAIPVRPDRSLIGILLGSCWDPIGLLAVAGDPPCSHFSLDGRPRLPGPQPGSNQIRVRSEQGSNLGSRPSVPVEANDPGYIIGSYIYT